MTNKGDEKMNATALKQPYKPLNKDKKAQLKKFIGNSSSKIDLNKVRDNWKYGKN